MESLKYQGRHIVTELAEAKTIQDIHSGLRNRQELLYPFISRQEKKEKKRKNRLCLSASIERPCIIPGRPGHA